MGYPASGSLFLAPGHLFGLLLLLEHRSLLWDLHIADLDVHLGHAQPDEVLHAVYDVATDGVREPRNRLAVLHGHSEVYRGLFLADLDAHAPGEVATTGAATGDSPGHALQKAADRRRSATSHLDLLDLLRSDAGD